MNVSVVCHIWSKCIWFLIGSKVDLPNWGNDAHNVPVRIDHKLIWLIEQTIHLMCLIELALKFMYLIVCQVGLDHNIDVSDRTTIKLMFFIRLTIYKKFMVSLVKNIVFFFFTGTWSWRWRKPVVKMMYLIGLTTTW